MADFFRASPWSEQQIGQSLSQFGLNDALKRALKENIEPIIYVSIDDSLTLMDKDTKALEGVDWFHDHNASTKKKSNYRSGSCPCQLSGTSRSVQLHFCLEAIPAGENCAPS